MELVLDDATKRVSVQLTDAEYYHAVCVLEAPGMVPRFLAQFQTFLARGTRGLALQDAAKIKAFTEHASELERHDLMQIVKGKGAV
jgi:hypothetical protein